MQDGAIAHFHIDGMQNCKVPDDHVIKHVHALTGPTGKSVDCRLCRVFVSFSSSTGEGNLSGKILLQESLGFVLFETNE